MAHKSVANTDERHPFTCSISVSTGKQHEGQMTAIGSEPNAGPEIPKTPFILSLSPIAIITKKILTKNLLVDVSSFCGCY